MRGVQQSADRQGATQHAVPFLPYRLLIRIPSLLPWPIMAEAEVLSIATSSTTTTRRPVLHNTEAKRRRAPSTRIAHSRNVFQVHRSQQSSTVEDSYRDEDPERSHAIISRLTGNPLVTR